MLTLSRTQTAEAEAEVERGRALAFVERLIEVMTGRRSFPSN